jgi:hypothetical protein
MGEFAASPPAASAAASHASVSGGSLGTDTSAANDAYMHSNVLSISFLVLLGNFHSYCANPGICVEAGQPALTVVAFNQKLQESAQWM